jgi:hypothetical protein
VRQDVGVDGDTQQAQPASAQREGPPGDGSAPSRGWRARVRRTPGGALFLKVAVFVLGLVFILVGLALAALPGPLTIPPILLGVWIWSSEFAWADRPFKRAQKSAREAWERAKQRPVVSALVTGSGLAAAGAGFYLVSRYSLIERARDVVGL